MPRAAARVWGCGCQAGRLVMDEVLQMPEEFRLGLVRLEDRVGHIEEDTKRIIRLLEGNGQPGLVVKVDRSERDVSEIKASQQWLTRTVWGAVIVALIGLGIQIVRSVPR